MRILIAIWAEEEIRLGNLPKVAWARVAAVALKAMEEMVVVMAVLGVIPAVAVLLEEQGRPAIWVLALRGPVAKAAAADTCCSAYLAPTCFWLDD